MWTQETDTALARSSVWIESVQADVYREQESLVLEESSGKALSGKWHCTAFPTIPSGSWALLVSCPEKEQPVPIKATETKI